MAEYKFKNAVSKWGASMGRNNYGKLDVALKVRVFKVRIDSGGYDNGWAYWGLGLPLYCAIALDMSDDICLPATDARNFVRARNRKEAIQLFGLKNEQLIRGEK